MRRIFFCPLEVYNKILFFYPNQLAKFDGINFFNLFRDNHQIVCRFVINQQVAVSVVNQSPCRVLGNISQNIIGGRQNIFFVNYLNKK